MMLKGVLFSFLWLGILVAGPTLEKGVAFSANFGYRYGHIFRPPVRPGVPDTVDYLLPVHRTTLLLRSRITPRDAIALHYKLRWFRIYENSFRRYIAPVYYEAEHHFKLGAGYAVTPRINPYLYYDYFGSRGRLNAHSAIFGAKLVVSAETMLEPTYQFTRASGLFRHLAVLRVRQVLTPGLLLMLKSSYTSARADTLFSRSCVLDAYAGMRADDRTAFHVGYRLYYDFSRTRTHTFWVQGRRRLSDDWTLQARYRGYSGEDLDSEQASEPIASDGIELKLFRSPLLKRGTGREYSGGLTLGLYANTRGVKSVSLGLELGRAIPTNR